MNDPRVLSAIDELEAFQADRSDSWNIPRAEGMILHTIALLGGCRRLVEVGTSYGFSGLFLASAARANGGVLHTFDVDPRKHEHAAEVFRRAGLNDCVHLHTGDARERLSDLDGRVDFAFLDATKDETHDYFARVEGKLADACTICVDNTSTHPEQLSGFVGMLTGRGDFTCCDVPVGNGFALAVRKA